MRSGHLVVKLHRKKKKLHTQMCLPLGTGRPVRWRGTENRCGNQKRLKTKGLSTLYNGAQYRNPPCSYWNRMAGFVTYFSILLSFWFSFSQLFCCSSLECCFAVYPYACPWGFHFTNLQGIRCLMRPVQSILMRDTFCPSNRMQQHLDSFEIVGSIATSPFPPFPPFPP